MRPQTHRPIVPAHSRRRDAGTEVHDVGPRLERLGALERSRRGWRLGMTLLELGQVVPRQQHLRDVALAYMEDLYEATCETVQLAVLDDGEVLYLEIIAGHGRPDPVAARWEDARALHRARQGDAGVLRGRGTGLGGAAPGARGPDLPHA
jgi:hypothetical protein